jgi:AI-2 transport protein TqsA
MEKLHRENTIYYAALTIIAAGVLVLMLVGKQIIIPIIVAVLLTYLIIALTEAVGTVHMGNYKLPKWVVNVVSFVVVTGVLYILGSLFQSRISDFVSGVPAYGSRIDLLFSNILHTTGLDISKHLSSVLSTENISGVARSFAGLIAGVGGSVLLILIYTIFMLIEYPSFKRRFSRLVTSPVRKEQIKKALKTVGEQSKTYLKIKTIGSLLTALLTFVILALFGVDTPLLWALFALVLNYIPNIGSIISVILPALLVIIQFGSLGLFVIITGLLVVVQVGVAQGIEPQLAGSSLNISPLVIIMSLFVCGAIWGVVGMFLSVPVVLMLRVIFDQFPETKPFADIMSTHRESLAQE